MTSREKYNAYRRAWWAKSLGEHLTESRVFLPRDAHEWVMRFAAEVEERIPFVLGKLVVAQIAVSEERVQEKPTVSDQPRAESLETANSVEVVSADNLHKLFYVVLASRFPGDTGSTRLRQVGFLAAVAAEVAAGRKPTASSIANCSDNHVSQITGLAKTMKERGVIDVRSASSVRKGKAAKIFSIRQDALKALHAAHVEVTGQAIDDITPP
ncbi:hypothetical protein LAV84_27965 [Rhizobium sp. VS19-DR104.2]|uniref:hypothetical protein n=1 Tax=unclassified Rhizobium TaxID=2613769 RepID=UPI001C5AED35|nr:MULTISPECIES: hypothetical protein [unclassified Rhizobium]MBZ5763355.1 hypothetical protein [Rhizobium sp. VS19-DR96]MBZ5769275.1 hypothetical protein [Rhizobium sp. VS19-DR129.2]MBZ5776821.1 hypothetical protein [Rhizobium sp. VS19-DRK62.2]MBZ5787874.1 hypothetical protein [Rhizobium sp. VS19-DR121]MBZ5805375.1 hypothetical protein [Rhizobium sp. VS19-DR181]